MVSSRSVAANAVSAASRVSISSSASSSSVACRRASETISCCMFSRSLAGAVPAASRSESRLALAPDRVDLVVELAGGPVEVADLGLGQHRGVAQLVDRGWCRPRSARVRAATCGDASAAEAAWSMRATSSRRRCTKGSAFGGTDHHPVALLSSRRYPTARRGDAPSAAGATAACTVQGSVRIVDTVTVRSGKRAPISAAARSSHGDSPAQCATSTTAGLPAIGDELGDHVVPQVGGEVDVRSGLGGRRQERVAGAAAHRDRPDHPVRVAGRPHPGHRRRQPLARRTA